MRFRHPQGAELVKLLDLNCKASLEDLFNLTLSKPLEQLFARPRKNLRGLLVELGFRMTGSINESNLQSASEILEMLHAGSLIVDDIEDSSSTRRGQPSLHVVYGVPLALNAGNWLYFLPFKYIDELEASAECKMQLTRVVHRTLLLAHYGQALDVGITLHSLPQERVYDVAMSAIELKTGVLTGFALSMGSLLCGQDGSEIDKLGRKLGVALQMFDDIGNLTSSRHLTKRAEDFKNARLSYLSGIAALELSASDYDDFLSLSLHSWSQPIRIQQWLMQRGVLGSARTRAESYLDSAAEELLALQDLRPIERELLANLCQKLKESYD